MPKLLLNIRHRNFQRLWWAQLISQFGDRINQLALVALIAQKSPGSAFELAKVLAFTIIPVFIIQPFAGVLVDRWDHKTTLFVSDMVRCLLVASIPFVFFYQDSMIPIYIVVFLVFCFSRFYVPAKMSIIPDIVDKDHLHQASSLLTTSGMIAFVIGVTIGGVIVENLGARDGFIIDSLTYFISGMFLVSLELPKHLRLNRERLRQARLIMREAKASAFNDIKEGFLYIKEHREMRTIINTIFILFAAAGAVYVVLIVFIQKSFNSVVLHLAFLAVPLGLGLFAGTVAHAKWGAKAKWFDTIFFCLIAGGVMLAVFAVIIHYYPVKALGIILAFILGMTIGPIFITANTVALMVSEEHMRGRVFSALEIVIHFAFLSAMLVSSWFSSIIEEVWILAAVGIMVVVVGIVGLSKRESLAKL